MITDILHTHPVNTIYDSVTRTLRIAARNGYTENPDGIPRQLAIQYDADDICQIKILEQVSAMVDPDCHIVNTYPHLKDDRLIKGTLALRFSEKYGESPPVNLMWHALDRFGRVIEQGLERMDDGTYMVHRVAHDTIENIEFINGFRDPAFPAEFWYALPKDYVFTDKNGHEYRDELPYDAMQELIANKVYSNMSPEQQQQMSSKPIRMQVSERTIGQVLSSLGLDSRDKTVC